MTITLELPPELGDRVSTLAAAEGLAPTDYLSRLLDRTLSQERTPVRVPTAEADAPFLAVLEALRAEEPTPFRMLSGRDEEGIALMKEWLAEGPIENPEEMHAAQAEEEELLTAINENRRRAGARLL